MAEENGDHGSQNNEKTDQDSLNVAAPTFSLQDEEKNISDYELWTFRLPSTIPIEDMENLELKIGEGSSCGKFESNGQRYELHLGDSVENESFRVLIPGKPDQMDVDDVDDDDSDTKMNNGDSSIKDNLRPSKLLFSRHVNVCRANEDLSETALAPRMESAPKPVDPMRRAYAPVPQRSGLKRRWMPMGCLNVPERTKKQVKEMMEDSKMPRNGLQATDTKSGKMHNQNGFVQNGSASIPSPTSDAKHSPKGVKRSRSKKEEKKSKKRIKKEKEKGEMEG